MSGHPEKPMPTLIRRLEALNERVGRAVAWLALAMVLVTFAIVLLRYLFNLGWVAMQETVVYMHAALFMFGAAYTLKHDGHVRVDIFYRRLGPRGQALVDLAGTLLLLIPFCLFIAWVSWDYVAAAWALKEGSREAGGLPAVYLLKAAIPAMALLLLVQGVALGLRSALLLSGRPDGAGEHDAPREL
jgi:TRAP-type mannitol/chloroaromatic compound transport system permease small subunit